MVDTRPLTFSNVSPSFETCNGISGPEDVYVGFCKWNGRVWPWATCLYILVQKEASLLREMDFEIYLKIDFRDSKAKAKHT
jgi:hypothetical protein